MSALIKLIVVWFTLLFFNSMSGQPSRYYLSGSLEAGNFGPKQYKLEAKDIQVDIGRYATPQATLLFMRRRNNRFSYGLGLSYLSWRIKQKIDAALPVYDANGNYTWRYTPTWLFQSRLGVVFKVNYDFNKISFSIDHGIYKVCGQNPVDLPYDYEYHRTQIIFPNITDFTDNIYMERYYNASRSFTQSISCFSFGYRLNKNFGIIASARFNWFKQAESDTSYRLYIHQTSEHNGQVLYDNLVDLTIREPSWSFSIGIKYTLPVLKKKVLFSE